MKKNVLSIIFASLLISAATLLTACKTDDLDAKIDDNASKVETSISDLTTKTAADIKTAADKAAQDLEAAKTELNAALAAGDKTNADELTAKVAELNTAIENANKALTDAKTALETSIANDAKALEDAKTALNDAIAKGDKANADALEAKVNELNTAIEANKNSINDAKTALETSIKDTKADLEKSINDLTADLAKKTADLDKLIKSNDTDIAALQTAKTNLENEIADVKAKYQALNNGLADLTADLNDAVADLTADLNDAVADLTADINNAIAGLKAELDGSISTTDAASMKIENWDAATDDVVDALIEAGKTNASADRTDYTTENQAKLDNLYFEVKVRLLRAPTTEACADILAEYKQAVADVLTISEVTWANTIDERVEKLTATIANSGYTKYAIEEYESIIESLKNWEEEVGEVNYKEVDREALTKLAEDYNAAQDKYNAANDAIEGQINAFLGDYTYVYTRESDDDYYAMDAVVEAYKAWYNDVASRNLIDNDIVDAFNEFNNGPHYRAHILRIADSEGAAINAKIAALTNELNNLKLIKSQYQNDLAEINKLIKKFDETYFSGNYAAEAVEGNTNYNLVDRAAKTALDSLYEEKLAEVFEAAETLKACMKKLETITTESKADVTAANEAWINFAKHLGDLGYDIEGLDKADVVVAKITAADLECDALIAEGNAIIEEIKTLNKKADDLVDNTVRAAYETSYNEIVAKVDAFVAKNNNIDYFKNYRDTLAAAKKAIADGAAISEVSNVYNNIITAIDGFNTTVKNDIKAKADENFNAAKEAIVSGDEDALKLANAKLELLAHAANEYATLAVTNEELAIKRYNLAIKTAFEQIEKSVDALESAKNVITETFAANA